MSTFMEQFLKIEYELPKEELVKKIKELEEENLKLKAKIKELPKKLADEIIEQVWESQDIGNLIDNDVLRIRVDAILKKYGSDL